MPGDLSVASGTLYAFLLVLARITGAFTFVPFPNMRAGTEPARIFAAIAISIALLPRWPVMPGAPQSIGPMALAVALEALLGLSIGLAVACFNEILQAAAQLISLQAGFSFASTVDPSTSADSGILVIVAQLMAGLTFFALGLDRQVVRIFADSLLAHPPGTPFLASSAGDSLWRFGATILSVGLRLALPAVALLALIDLALALLGRIQSQLNLLSLAMPLKMTAAFALLAVLVTLFPRILGQTSVEMIRISRRAAGLEGHVR